MLMFEGGAFGIMFMRDVASSPAMYRNMFRQKGCSPIKANLPDSGIGTELSTLIQGFSMPSWHPYLSCTIKMINRASTRYFANVVLAGFVLHSCPAFADKTVHSLSDVRGAMHTPDAQKMFDHSMNGVSQSDGFGTKLPAGFTQNFLLEQLAPGEDARDIILSGAKPWPQRPNSYVAMICLANTPEAAADAKKYPPVSCGNVGNHDTPRVWFGVFENNGAGPPQLVARTDSPVSNPTDWSDTNIELPVDLEERDANSTMEDLPSSWSRFDLAAYQLRPGDYAFGVRAGWSEGYAGGGADFEALYLFVMDGKSLRVVFAQPMAFDKMLAGEWNKDGTRNHDVSDAANALVVLPSTTSGFHDLQLREKGGGKWRNTFKWSATQGRYVLSVDGKSRSGAR